MQSKVEPQERLLPLFAQRRCWTIEELMHKLDYAAISVRRLLKQVGYFSSFTHNNKWYTLKSIPVFDKYGLWFYENIGFSKNGSLKKTILYFIAKSPQGLSAKQLSERLLIPCHAVLNHLYKRGAIDRFKSDKAFVYLAIDDKIKSRQFERLQSFQPVEVRHSEGLSAQAAVHVLVEFIKRPDASVVELSQAVAKKQVLASPEAIARFFEEHALKKNTTLIELLHFYQQQVQTQNAPAQFFDNIPVLTFTAEQKTCPLDGQPLQVWKTHTRTIKALGIGTFKARHVSLYCKNHRELGPCYSQELAELVPAYGNAAYNVIVKVGQLRFRENRQVREIQQILFHQPSIDLCAKEIELLIDKFIFYLAAVHQESTELIKAQIKAQGGYILHVDSTCEGDSPKLASSPDSVSGFVLYSVKLNTENQEEVVTFLGQIKSRFGAPHAVVSDMSKGIEAAVQEVFGLIAHYVCHFHFLTVIGLLLLEKEHLALRQALSKAGISGKLKALARKLSKSFETLTLGEIENYLATPEQLGKTSEATDLLAYYLMLWILDHAAEGHGYGFPFDQRYLNFYERLQAAHTLINEVKVYYPAQTENDAILWRLYHWLAKIVGDRNLQQTVVQYKIKLAIFSNLRQAMGAAPEPASNGLRQLPVTTSHQELQKIRASVEAFMRTLDRQIQQATEQPLRDNLIKVKERITSYGDRLFADPFVVEVNGEKRYFFVHRTNNIVEQHFRQCNYGYRRIHGNRSVRRNLENIPEQLPLVENLRNSNYVELIFGDDTKIAKRFAEIDVKTIRKMSAEHRAKKKLLCSRKTKRILRRPEFTKKLVAAFAVVAG